MTPEAQRMAIAEACPKVLTNINGTWYWKDSVSDQFQRCLNGDPLSDLNAMHEAEKAQGWHDKESSEADTYFKELLAICCRFPGFPTYCATAAQRAEAFLRTLNLWINSDPYKSATSAVKIL